MPEVDFTQTTTTNLTGGVTDYSVTPAITESTDLGLAEYHINFDKFKENYGYYLEVPELNRAINALATWTIGKGFEFDNRKRKVEFDHLTGQGKDADAQLLMNQFIVMKFNGDSFAEIIRDGRLMINLKPLSPDKVRLVFNSKGILKRYEYFNHNGWRKIPIENMFHLSNDRVADEPRGQALPQVCKWVIDARKEAMNDWRRISHRSTIRVMYMDYDDADSIASAKATYKDAINKGELMILPGKKEEIGFEDLTLPPHSAFLEWMRYLENVFYQVVGVPRVIATSENFTEAGSKVGYATFEPVYTKEQLLLEKQIWNQLGVKITFKRPPSLMDNLQREQTQNQGQLGVQPNDTQIGVGEA